MSGQSNYLSACFKIFSFDVMFANVILTLILNFGIYEIVSFFSQKSDNREFKAEKFFAMSHI